jgi:hypothetical protein
MNVVGASVSEAFYAAHETRDIVLPNQTEHVSQIAVDVCFSFLYILYNHTIAKISIDWWFFGQSHLLYLISRS